jgi:hypothetical protein
MVPQANAFGTANNAYVVRLSRSARGCSREDSARISYAGAGAT